MRSPATRHFPTVVFRNKERCLWNSLQRKPLVNRPEERVRLRYLDYLLLEAGWPRNRVAIETLIRPSGKSAQMRADLICYSRNMDPVILVECKSGSVKPGESAAFQIARYNKAVGAEFICITNGLEDHWFRINRAKADVMQRPPFSASGTGFQGPDTIVGDMLPATDLSQDTRMNEPSAKEGSRSGDASTGEGKSFAEARSDPGYWQQRGFLGTGSRQSLTEIMTDVLLNFWESGSEEKSAYLTFQTKYRDVPFDHYYRLFDVQETCRLAVTFTGSACGETWLIALLNREQVAEGFVAVNMDKLYSGDVQSGELVVKGGSVTFDAGTYFQFETFRTEMKSIEAFVLKLYDIFNNETEI